MTCYHPLTLSPPGMRAQRVACGRCIGCRVDRSRMWAARCVHEASLHEDNCFLTLTYDDFNLPETGGLDKTHFQKFIKALRKKIYPQKLSYIHSGEYGENLGRPHYHALIFGFDFPDKRPYGKSKDGQHQRYTSGLLDSLWKKGRAEIGSVTFQSAAYVGRYCVKKVMGDQAAGWYQKINPETGEINDVSPEYLTCSTRPAIGKRWFEQFATDVFPCDFVVVAGKKIKLPRYYDKLHKRSAAAALKDVKQKRFKHGIKNYKNSTPARLAVREEVKRAQLGQLKRNIE